MQATTAEKVKTFDPTRWVDAHGDFLFALAISRVRDAVAAETILQETLLAAAADRRSFEEEFSERRWLAEILKRRIIEHFRGTRIETDLTPEEKDLSSYDYLFADETWKDHWTEETMPRDWQTTPGEALEKGEFCAVLEHCLDELPLRIAKAFTMREMDGVGAPEICEILNVSPNNYRIMLHRARTHLRRCLEYDWFRKANV